MYEISGDSHESLWITNESLQNMSKIVWITCDSVNHLDFHIKNVMNHFESLWITGDSYEPPRFIVIHCDSNAPGDSLNHYESPMNHLPLSGCMEYILLLTDFIP